MATTPTAHLQIVECEVCSKPLAVALPPGCVSDAFYCYWCRDDLRRRDVFRSYWAWLGDESCVQPLF
jgi:hypothetical protein